MVLLSVVLAVAATLGVLYGLNERGYLDGFTESAASPFITETVTTQVGEQVTNIPDIVEQTIPAVVSVVITAEVPVIERYYEEFSPFGFWGGFSVPRQRQIGTEEREIGGGTGFFVSPDGMIITNRHVVDQEGVEYSVVTNEGESYEVEVVARDPMLDIAVLQVVGDDEQSFPHLSFSASEPRLGATVIAIGNALAEFPNSVSVGVVSGLARNIVASSGWGEIEALEGVIQTDAAINQGNSGGPLLNTDGEVVGVNVAVAGGSENIGFSIPAETVERVYESVREFGEIQRPYLGIRYVQLTPEIAARNGMEQETGVMILRGESRTDFAVIPGSPADRAGLEESDIITTIDGVDLDGERSFASILRDYSVGDTATLTILRDGEEQTVEVMFAAAPEM
jgi:S1-C subfamily serine protease